MNATFPERLKEIRESRNITQDDLAERVGANRVAISRYESGIISPSSKRMSSLAEALGVTVEYLMGGERTPEQQEQDEEWEFRERIRRDPDFQLLYKAIKKASPEHIRAATAVLKSLEQNDD